MPSRSRTQSISSDRPSTVAHSLMSPPLSVSPEPAFIAASAASQIVTNDHDSHAETWYDQHGIEPSGETAAVSPAALQLVNSFLDQLLFNFLSVSRSTSLHALRPAVSEVLKPKLAKDAINQADEELREYLGGDDEDATLAHARDPVPSNNWDLELAWKRTRLRCMVYSSLGDMEEEDEDYYMEQGHLDTGLDDRFSEAVSPAVAIFLTSILEFMGEQALIVAGQAAYHRMRSKYEKDLKDGVRSPTGVAERIVVEDLDMERVALDRTLGRLWRSWKKKIRSPAVGSADRLNRSYSRDSLRSATGHLRSPSTAAEPAVPATVPEPHAEIEQGESDAQKQIEDSREPLEEHLVAAAVPLPIGPNDIAEIEVPGLALYNEGESADDGTADVNEPARPKMAYEAGEPGARAGPDEYATEDEEMKEDVDDEVSIEEPRIVRSSRVSILGHSPSTGSSEHGRPASINTNLPVRTPSIHSARLIDVAGPRSPAVGSRRNSVAVAESIRQSSPPRTSRTVTPPAQEDRPVQPPDSASGGRLSVSVPNRSGLAASASISEAEEAADKEYVVSPAIPVSPAAPPPVAKDRHEPAGAALQDRIPERSIPAKPTTKVTVLPAMSSPVSTASSTNGTFFIESMPVLPEGREIPEPPRADSLRSRSSAAAQPPPPAVPDRSAGRQAVANTSALRQPATIGQVSVERSRPRSPSQGSSSRPRDPSAGRSKQQHASGSPSSTKFKPVRTSEDGMQARIDMARNFEELIQSDQTIQYTLTPENMRELDARGAAVDYKDDNSDLIDFIRRGPPSAPGNHRIPRAVAPFRTTMDSDQMSNAVGGKAVDAQLRDVDMRSSQASTNATESSVPPSIQSSVNSHSALLTRNKPPTSYDAAEVDMPMPKRKTRRVRDPYAIDISDEELEEDEEPVPVPVQNRRKRAQTQEESLIDFLNNYAPPPEPTVQPFNTAQTRNMLKPKKKASAPSLMARSAASTMTGSSGAVGGRVPMKKFVPREPVSVTNRGTSDLAEFLKHSGPPAGAASMGNQLPGLAERDEANGLSKVFTRRKRPSIS
ncbi:76f3eb27-5a2c-4f9b-8fde-c4730b874cb5 [Thermothielavioides terrestris]|uniref:76f3eb27-5a2c-4f9b-8fde-c4730b874cb5 n=1 Tax=Thermothielavioides terrestris TaxID=2587410 RepID=A0A446BIF5_9PEZI|nr:76f3eb27-5a2c-4f9b-8fde-c4730b874cb5 [Thermothielavioides terrestris]